MIDQLVIGDKASYDDYGASLAKRKIGMPKKKIIKETVPFSNLTYDFSAINGEVYWEERELEYVLEIIADNPEKLEEAKLKLSGWLLGIQDEEIHDPFIPDYHFKGTFSNMDFEDDEGLEKTTATVTFSAYPYKIGNLPKVYTETLGNGKNHYFTIMNESDHPVRITVTASQNFSIRTETFSAAFWKGTIADERMVIPKGLTEVQVTNSSPNNNTVSISFYEEVF